MARVTGKVVAGQRGLAEPLVVDDAHALRLHERPIDAHDSFALEALQRFRERQKPRPRLLMKTNFAKVGSALGRPYGQDAVVFQERLKMPVRFRFLPERINLRWSAFLDEDGEARGLDLEEFHGKKSPPENYGKEDQTTVAAFL